MIDPDGTHFHCQHWSNSCCVKAYLCTTREEETKQSGCRGFFLLQKKKKNNHRFKKNQKLPLSFICMICLFIFT